MKNPIKWSMTCLAVLCLVTLAVASRWLEPIDIFALPDSIAAEVQAVWVQAILTLLGIGAAVGVAWWGESQRTAERVVERYRAEREAKLKLQIFRELFVSQLRAFGTDTGERAAKMRRHIQLGVTDSMHVLDAYYDSQLTWFPVIESQVVRFHELDDTSRERALGLISKCNQYMQMQPRLSHNDPITANGELNLIGPALVALLEDISLRSFATATAIVVQNEHEEGRRSSPVSR